MAWLKFEDLDEDRMQPNVVISMETNDLFYIPFPGLNPGYQFGDRGPPVVAQLGADARDWHHYTQSWVLETGERKMYIDGVLVYTDHVGHRNIDSGGLRQDARMAMHFGLHCYAGERFKEAYTICNREASMSGTRDDVAIFTSVLSDAEVQALPATAL